jgi:hypothetical protein
LLTQQLRVDISVGAACCTGAQPLAAVTDNQLCNNTKKNVSKSRAPHCSGAGLAWGARPAFGVPTILDVSSARAISSNRVHAG